MDGVVAVRRDGAQVQDGRRARQDVEREPHIAEHLAEHPLTARVADHVERHDEHGDGQVGDGE